jgi:hypothetical protein
MNKNTVVVILGILFSFASFASPFEEILGDHKSINNANKSRDSSYLNVITDKNRGKYLEKNLGIECFAFVRKVYEKGGDFYTEALHKARRPIMDTAFSEWVVDGNETFHHYTNASQVYDIFNKDNDKKRSVEAHEDGVYEEIFEFVRTNNSRGTAKSRALWNSVFYISSGTESYFDKRKYLNNLTLSPSCSAISTSDELWQAALDEVELRLPGLKKACGDKLNQTYIYPGHDYGFHHKTSYIMAEDSGVEMMQYVDGYDFFQLLSSRCIEVSSAHIKY